MKETPYDDILELPHPDPVHHPRMTRENRAAQFAPFAALTGYDAVIKETGRNTYGRIFLEESEIERINEKLCFLDSHPECEISISFYLADKTKEGGSYQEYTGRLRKIDINEQQLITIDSRRIPFSDIISLSIF